MKCGNEECGMEIKDGRAMTCSKCKKQYCFDNEELLNKCGGWTQKSWNSVGKKRKSEVVCMQCKEENDLSKNEDDQQKGEEKVNESKKEENNLEKTPNLSDILLALVRMEKILTEVRDEQKALQQNVDFISKQYDDMKKEHDSLKNEVKTLKKEVREANQQVKEKEDVISNLQKRVLESERYVRNRNVELQGVIEEEGEDVEEIVCKTAAALGVQLKKEEIEAAHRVMSRNTAVPRPIIAQLGSRKKRDEMLSKKTHAVYNKQVIRSRSGEGRVNVYEQLPQYVKELRWKAKCRAIEKDWKFVWIDEGKVLARQAPGKRTVKILTERDIELIT